MSGQTVVASIVNYMIGELQRCRDAASGLQIPRLASATRNLFDLSFAVDYVCASNKNLERFEIDGAIDELEIMKQFSESDARAGDGAPNSSVQSRIQNLKARIAKASLTGKRPLMPWAWAKAVGRKAEYDEWYRTYSKMSHATAWAILGRCSWEDMALLLLIKANFYTAECIKKIDGKIDIPVRGPNRCDLRDEAE